jgi:hypothetical protein
MSRGLVHVMKDNELFWKEESVAYLYFFCIVLAEKSCVNHAVAPFIFKYYDSSVQAYESVKIVLIWQHSPNVNEISIR